MAKNRTDIPSNDENVFTNDTLIEGATLPAGVTREEYLNPKKPEPNVSKAFQQIATTFSDIYASTVYPDDFLIINDVVLTDVPTTSVNFSSSNGAFIAETLRTDAPIVSSNYSQSMSIELSLMFDTTAESQDKLRRLVSVISVYPIVFIYNNKIRRNVGAKPDETTMFILDHGTLRTSSETIGVLILDLTLHYFNYKPFSNHFWFNANLPGDPNGNALEKTIIKKDLTKNAVGDLTGYDVSDFYLDLESKQMLDDMVEGTYNIDINRFGIQNQPVPFPGASKCWMYFAEHLYNQSSPLSDTTSDYIGFEIKEYEQFKPVKDAQITAATPKALMYEKNEYPPVASFYEIKEREREQDKVLSKTSSQRKAEQYASATQTSESSKDGKIKIYGVDTNTIKWFDLSESNFLDEFARITTSTSIKNKLASQRKNVILENDVRWILLDLAELFPGKRITVLKSIGAGDGPHGRGEAIDVKVQDVSAEKVYYDMRQIKGWGKKQGGAGLYTHAKTQFCHFDIGKTRFWIDKSGPGEKADALSYASRLNYLEDLKLRFDNTTRAQISDSTAELWNEETDWEGQTVDEQQIQKEKEEARKTSKNIAVRAKWIRDTEEAQGMKYYWEDSNVKNIFYRNVYANVSGDESLQRNGAALKNIVCSSVSLNFGHRIVPQRLIGQDTCTWQFIGAGNKSGTMVFTFAGETGRASSDEIKTLFHRARKNYKLFGAIIPDAGAIRINRDNPVSGKVNNLLALLKIDTIVISDVKEVSIPSGNDQHQLLVTFIVQKFTEEGLDKKFLTTSESKSRLISSILKFVEAKKINDRTVRNIDGVEYKWKDTNLGFITDNRHIKPKPSVLVSYDENRFRTTNSEFPAWLAELIVKAAKVCNRLNAEMPPSRWKVNKHVDLTWEDRYAEVGADNIMLGQVSNIEKSEMNGYSRESIIGSPTIGSPGSIIGDKLISPSNYKEMEKGVFTYNGGSHTNEIHERIYTKFLDQMNFIIDEAKKYMVDDRVNFKKYFGSVSDDLLEEVLASVGECYQDLNMPTIPNADLNFPPEFYVFDDSKEDPYISGLTDDYNMEKYLRKHIENERASIQHYLKDVFLGGSYLSQNMPKILRERDDYLREFRQLTADNSNLIGEDDFFNPNRMLGEGTKSWDPLYYRLSDDDYPVLQSRLGGVMEGKDAIAWKGNVDKEYQSAVDMILNQIGVGSGDQASRFKFMDNVIAMSPYLKYGRGQEWARPYTDNNAEVIESIYDDNWRNIQFGPNPENCTADERLNGYVASAQTMRSRELQMMSGTKLAAKEENRAIETNSLKGAKRTVLPDGNVVVGDGDAERQSLIDKYIEDPKSAVADAAGLAWTIGKYNPLTAIPTWSAEIAWNVLEDAFESVEDRLDKEQRARELGLSDPSQVPNVHEELYNEIAKQNQDSNLAKMVKGIAFGTKAKDLSVRRVFPTFKIYFIEDDAEETKSVDGKILRAYDDFYSTSSIQEIKITRSRKIAADLAVIRMTNIGGKLLRKRYGEKDPSTIAGDGASKYGVAAEYATGFLADTESENPFENLILKDGVKTQIRLGYANDPDLLETVFLGEIVEILPTEDGKIIEIMVQGYGAELENVELGPLEDGPVFFSTQQALSAAIIQDSIVNFGRRSKFNKFNVGESRHAFTGGLGKSITGQAIDDLINEWGDRKLYKLFYKYQFLNYPQDDNIYAPPPCVYATTWQRFWNNACIYRPLNQTPWEIFKEHELRHPGYISLAVPYGHSPRMTMFFGAKGQHYWSRPPSLKETFLSQALADNILLGRGISDKAKRNNPFYSQQIKEIAKVNPKVAKALLLDLSHSGAPTETGKALGELFGRYVPFRNYHYFDAEHHILKNEIKTSKDGVFNEIELLYFENEDDLEEGSSDDLAANMAELVRKESGVLACKLDENLPQKNIRSYTKEYPSCVTKDMAKRYIQGLFARHLRDAYKGELIVLGEPTLKPYDICYLNDTSINMTGPVEVEAVTHIFNRDMGFISIVTPDLCIDINDFYSASVFDVVGAAYSALHLDDLASSSIVGTGVSSLSYLGLAAAFKVAQWTQDGVPVFSTPLTLAGKPFMSVSMGYGNASFFSTLFGQWRQKWDDAVNGWDDLDMAEALMDTSLSWQESIATFMSSGRGAGYSTEEF